MAPSNTIYHSYYMVFLVTICNNSQEPVLPYQAQHIPTHRTAIQKAVPGIWQQAQICVHRQIFSMLYHLIQPTIWQPVSSDQLTQYWNRWQEWNTDCHNIFKKDTIFLIETLCTYHHLKRRGTWRMNRCHN